VKLREPKIQKTCAFDEPLRMPPPITAKLLLMEKKWVSALGLNCIVPIEVAGVSIVTLVLGAVSKVATLPPLGVVPVDQLMPLFQLSSLPTQVASAPAAGPASHKPAAAVVPNRTARKSRPRPEMRSPILRPPDATHRRQPDERAPLSARCSIGRRTIRTLRVGYTAPERHQLCKIGCISKSMRPVRPAECVDSVRQATTASKDVWEELSLPQRLRNVG
jgi:hypothetical protein